MSRPIGGEIEIKKTNNNYYFTDSGRSSLRLFIQSDNHNKTYLIPDFLCDVIEKTLIEENVRFDYYHINKDLSINERSLQEKNFDVLYVIHYFGTITALPNISLDSKILLEDFAFHYDFHNSNNIKHWYAFNSYRKITPVSDGSLIKTTLKINSTKIERCSAPFSDNKYIAKERKFDFIHKEKGEEKNYLKSFLSAESLINTQKKIYSPSHRSLYLLSNYNNQSTQELRKTYFQHLKTHFASYCINPNPDYYTHFVLNISEANLLKIALAGKGIYLPMHWSGNSQKNNLYNTLISIPTFEIYSKNTYQKLIKVLLEIIP